MKTKKIVSIALASLMVVSIFAGCSKDPVDSNVPSSKPESTKTPDEKVTLKLGIWPDDTMTDEIKMHEGFVKTYNEIHSNVDVVPAYYKYATDTFVSMAEAGNLPTIFESWYTEPQKLIKGGFVKDITDILKERGWLDAINPSIRKLMSDDSGKVYGIPRDGYALGLMCNVALFKEAGLANADGTIQYPKTWEELAQISKTIKEKTGAAGLCLLAKDNAGGWHFSNIAWNFGADLCSVDANGKFISNLESAEAIAAMEYVKSLKWDYNALTADPTSEDWATGFTELGTGVAAMYIAANDAVMQPTYSNGLPVGDLTIVPLPAGPKGQYSLSGGTPYMFAANATDAEVNAALDYLEIMGKAPVASEAAIKGMEDDAKYRVDNGIPVIARFPCWTKTELLDAEKKVLDKFNNVNPALYNDYFAITKKEGNLRMEEEGDAQAMYAELTNVIQAVITNKKADVAALMKTANKNYQTILDTTLNK